MNCFGCCYCPRDKYKIETIELTKSNLMLNKVSQNGIENGTTTETYQQNLEPVSSKTTTIYIKEVQNDFGSMNSYENAAFVPELKEVSVQNIEGQQFEINGSLDSQNPETKNSSGGSAYETLESPPSYYRTPSDSTSVANSCDETSCSRKLSESSNIDSLLPLLTQSDLNLFRNMKAVNTVMPEVFRKVIAYACIDKKESETYIEYMNRKKIGRRRLQSHDVAKLSKSKNCNDFDVSLLYTLIRACGSKLAHYSDEIWKKQDYSRIECLLTKAKDLRNEISHKVSSTSDTLSDIEIVLQDIIRAAGVLYELPEDKVTSEISHIHHEVEKIKNMSMSTREQRISRIHSKLRKDCRKEMSSYWKTCYMEEYLHFGGLKAPVKKIYHPMTLTHKDVDPSTRIITPRVVTCFDICRNSHEIPITNGVIIEGHAGAGKSLTMKVIGLEFLFPSGNPDFEVLSEYEIAYFVKCRNQSNWSMEELLRSSYSRVSRSIDHMTDLVDAAYGLKSLFVLEGIEEADNSFSKLIREFLERSKSNCPSTFIFTTRSYYTETLQHELDSIGLNYNTYKMNDIATKEEQVEFLMRYEKVFNKKMNGLTTGFKRLNKSLTSHFNNPRNLILFCYIFEQSNSTPMIHECDIFQKTLLKYQSLIEHRLRSKGITNLPIIITRLLEEVYELSIQCVHKVKNYLTKDECTQFYLRCYDLLPGNVIHLEEVFSTIFVRKLNPCSIGDKICFQFYSVDIQEYMASKALLKKLENDRKKHIKDILEELTRSQVSRTDMYKYINVFAYAIIQLMERNKQDLLNERIDDLSELLQETGQDEFTYWSKIILKCKFNADFIKQAAQRVEVGEWNIHSSTIEAGCVLLKHKHPRQIIIDMPDTDGLPEEVGSLFSTLTETEYTGGLLFDIWYSYYASVNLDPILAKLKHSKCKLWRFTGCIGNAGAAIIAPLLTRRTTLSIALAEPLQHNLGLVPINCFAILEIAVEYSEDHDLKDRRQPLPETALGLGLRGVPSGASDWVVDTVKALSPNRGCEEVFLLRCCLSDTELDEVLEALAPPPLPPTQLKRWTIQLTRDDGSRDILLWQK